MARLARAFAPSPSTLTSTTPTISSSNSTTSTTSSSSSSSRTPNSKVIFSQVKGRVGEGGRRRQSWAREGDRRAFFLSLGRQLGLDDPSDPRQWLTPSHLSKTIAEHGGRGLLARYDGSPLRAIESLFPPREKKTKVEGGRGGDGGEKGEGGGGKWRPWLAPVLPKGYWDDSNNQRNFFVYLGEVLGYSKPEDYYGLTRLKIIEHGGASLLSKYYGDSPARFVQAMLPSFPFYPWRFNSVPRKFWDSLQNKKSYIAYLVLELKLRENDMEELYRLKQSDFRLHNGNGLLAKFDGSVSRLISTVFQEYHWLPWKFNHNDKAFWSDRGNQREFFEWFRGEAYRRRAISSSSSSPSSPFSTSSHHMISLDDFYGVRMEDIVNAGGKNFLAPYGFSLSEALKSVYPEHQWFPHLFTSTPQGFWKDATKVREFLDYFARRFLNEEGEKKSGEGGKDEEEVEEKWYRVPHSALVKIGGSGIESIGGMYQILSFAFPERKWDKERLSLKASKRSSQLQLVQVLRRVLLPNTALIEEHQSRTLVFEETNQPIEFDVFAPDLHLAFEYQGRQHYEDTMIFGLAEQYKERDKEKRLACARAGISLIEVPFWWKGDEGSIIATVGAVRPDALAQQHRPLDVSSSKL